MIWGDKRIWKEAKEWIYPLNILPVPCGIDEQWLLVEQNQMEGTLQWRLFTRGDGLSDSSVAGIATELVQ